jgi:hypothetical protein
VIQLELALVGASSLKDGNPRYQCSLPVGDDNADVAPFGEIPVATCLGVTSLPYPKDANGHAEAVVARGLGSRKGFVIGARDTRAGKIVGKMDPGDSVLHSTDPDQTAQVRVQGKKKSASVIVKGSNGKHMMVLLDGKNNKAQVLANGATIEIDDGGDISLLGKGGGGILIQGNTVSINGVLKLPGLPPQHFLVATPMAQFVGLTAAVALGGTPGPVSPVMNVGGYT